MEITTEALDIRQDTATEKFRFDMKGDADAYLKYKLHTKNNPTVVEFTDMHVPKVLNGIGLEDAFALKAVRFVEKTGYKMKSSSSYMSGYFNRHPEFSHLRTR
jgi:predicted GNAT family acetyltransferase